MVRPSAPPPPFRPRPLKEIGKAPVPVAVEKPAPKGPVFASAPKPKYEPKPLFSNRGVSASADVDPWIANHALCKGLDRKSLSRIRNTIDEMDVRDNKKVMEYGEVLRTKFSDMIDSIVNISQSGLMDPAIQESVDKILGWMKSVSVDAIFAHKPINWWQAVTSPREYKVQKNIADPAWQARRILDVVTNVELESFGLALDAANTVERVDALEALYHENYDNYKLLNLQIIAGKLFIEDQNNRAVPALKRTVDESDPFKVQDFLYYKDCLTRFENKVVDLEIISHTMAQKAPQIRMMQMTAKTVADDMRRLEKTTIPNWRMYATTLAERLQKDRYMNLASIQHELQHNQAKLLHDLNTVQKELLKDFTK